MKIFIFISFLFLIDLYFYFGTIDVIGKVFNNIFVYKYLYWIISVLLYVFLIYIAFIPDKETTHIRVNKNVVYVSIFTIFFFSKLIGSIPLLLDDVFRFFKFVYNIFTTPSINHDIGRLDFLKKSALLFFSTLSLTFLSGIVWGRYNFKKNYQDIFIERWPEEINGYKIIHISDLHLGSFNSIDKLEKVVELINNEYPDMVVFTGDLVNTYYHEALPYVNTLKKIKAKYGKFSILGNHDYGDYAGIKRSSKAWQDNFNQLIKLQKAVGFDILLNESRDIIINGNRVNLVGVENWGDGNFNKDGDLEKAMKSVDDNLPTILLSHDPSHWSNVVLKSNYKIDLQLSGHTHGMQFGIEVPGFKWSPSQYRYKQWAGLYEDSKRQIYVNRGLGHLAYAGRVGIMPDISILSIKTKI
tara:strand:+ start:8799 stop:10034 length:1236 start_codon:yes stop_codon:yes gene_type:complete